MALNITRGVVKCPVKCVIYGVEGVGKTTLAAQTPDPLFIDLEHGTERNDVARISDCTTWEALIDAIREVAVSDVCRTLVIDTLDAAERMCTDFTIRLGGSGVTSIESFGYGKGYTMLAENFNRLLLECDRLIANGINVVMIAHAMQRKIELPDQVGAYDHWELKLSKKASPLAKEWPDMLLFMNYKTTLITTETKTKKATGGQRYIYATHSPNWDAKNRYGLPDQFEASWEAIKECFYNAPKDDPLGELRSKLVACGISEEAFAGAVASRNADKAGLPLDEYDTSFIKRYCLKHFNQIINLVKEAT